MQIGFLATKSAESFLPRMKKILSRKGHSLACSVYVDSDLYFASASNFAAMQSQAIVFYGNKDMLFDALKNDYEVDSALSLFELNDTLYAVMDEYSDEYMDETVLPMLNSRCKTLYTTEIIKTFSKSEEELRELLKNEIKNRNRIAISFYPSECECEIDIRYSSKMSREIVNSVISNVKNTVKEYTYAYRDISLAQRVFEMLQIHRKRVCIAESFTGGAIASALTLCPGASEFVSEGIVSYTNESKIRRLGVSKHTLESWGAVSSDCVYEMAVNIMRQSGCDVCVATSGNAGPKSEREGEVGRCYIAVGDMSGIHIFEHDFHGNRESITECGTKYALYYLYKQLQSYDERMIEN